MKKLTLILAAFALTFGFSQCKKAETPTTDKGVKIILTAGYGNGAKTDFTPAAGAFVWTNGQTEYIYVGGSQHAACLGALSGTGNGKGSMTFSGTLTITPNEGETLHFFYLGKGRNGSAVSTLDFSTQDGTLEDVTNYHIAIGDGSYSSNTINYATTLNMAMAIAYFDVNGFKNASETAEVVYLHGDEVYSTATINYREGTITGDAKGNINLGTATAGKYVALIPSVSTETTLKFDSDSKTGAMTFLRGIQAGKYYANSSAALSVVANSCLFSIPGAKKVRFSQGNLQYTKSTGVWSFMEHQYDIVETSDQNVGVDYAVQDVVSHFGWGTSGWNNGNTYFQPYNTTGGGKAYGPTEGNLTDGNANADWGVYNAISNGGNLANLWRTLTKDEWNYVLNTRSASTVNGTANARYAKAAVANVQGLILFPDSYTHPVGVDLPTNINNNNNGNDFTVSDFALMEANGAVFLPCAGIRYGATLSYVGAYGGYWSSTKGGNGGVAQCLCFRYDSQYNFLYIVPEERQNGSLVRLVRDIE